jgi:hypothetical protein
MILSVRVCHRSLMVPEYQMSGEGPGCAGGRHHQRGMVEGTMVTVKPASMLFGGGANRRLVDVFRPVSTLILESF